MNRTLLLILVTVGLALAPISLRAQGVDSIWVDSIMQLDQSISFRLVEGHPVTYFIRISHQSTGTVTGQTNGFIVWAQSNGSFTGNQTVTGGGWMNTIDWNSYWDGIQSYHWYLHDIPGPDTLKYGAFKIFSPGLPSGFDEISWYTTFVPSQAGDTLCIDSSFAPPGGSWLWSTPSGSVVPGWMDTLCIPVVCCFGSQGNVDVSEGPGLQTDISDLVALASYIFPPHTPLLCNGVGNVDGLSSGVPIDIADVTYLVDYLFGGGPPPVACGP